MQQVCWSCGALRLSTELTCACGAALGELEPGELLDGHLRLEKVIGKGGMGRVFLATDLRIERAVAVKVINRGGEDPDFVFRFEREARLLGTLDHPNLVTVHSFGTHRDAPYMVMKLLDGVTLRAHLGARGGRLEPLEALGIIRQLGDVLGYLHARGVLHRDLKPGNVMIAATGQLTLFDLGIARPRDSDYTLNGAMCGTPGYMAPEQLLGEKSIDARADLYALAVLCFRVLTGAMPFTGDDASVAMAHLRAPRPDAATVQPALPRAVGAALRKAMAIAPGDRFGSARELVDALEAALDVGEWLPPSRAIDRALRAAATVPMGAQGSPQEPRAERQGSPTEEMPLALAAPTAAAWPQLPPGRALLGLEEPAPTAQVARPLSAEPRPRAPQPTSAAASASAEKPPLEPPRPLEQPASESSGATPTPPAQADVAKAPDLRKTVPMREAPSPSAPRELRPSARAPGPPPPGAPSELALTVPLRQGLAPRASPSAPRGGPPAPPSPQPSPPAPAARRQRSETTPLGGPEREPAPPRPAAPARGSSGADPDDEAHLAATFDAFSGPAAVVRADFNAAAPTVAAGRLALRSSPRALALVALVTVTLLSLAGALWTRARPTAARPPEAQGLDAGAAAQPGK